MVISWIIWIIFGLLLAYLLVVGIITIGWMRLSVINQNANQGSRRVKISVIVAVRNEEDNIGRLLNQIVGQDYNKEFFEVLIVNDHSEDSTVEIINRTIAENHNCNIKLINASGDGKKNAISEGVANSKGELVVTTDGDCEVPAGWLSEIVLFYENSDYKVICGPVIYSENKSLISKFFTLDFASLVASGAGSIGAGLPLMGNGANLAFEKKIFSGFNDNESYASGDDVFLIHYVAKKYGHKSIGFINKENVVVQTDPPAGIREFMKQRIRWASKASGYRLLWPLLVSFTVFLFNLGLFVILLFSISFPWLLPIYMLLIITKFMIDLPLVFRFLNFVGNPKLKPYFFIMEIIYPVYIVAASLLSLFAKYEWKNRKGLS